MKFPPFVDWFGIKFEVCLLQAESYSLHNTATKCRPTYTVFACSSSSSNSRSSIYKKHIKILRELQGTNKGQIKEANQQKNNNKQHIKKRCGASLWGLPAVFLFCLLVKNKNSAEQKTTTTITTTTGGLHLRRWEGKVGRWEGGNS